MEQMGGNERKSKKEGDERGERKQSEAGLGKRELDGRKRGSTNVGKRVGN